MNEKMKLVEDHIIGSYAPGLIMSDMVSDVIIHDAYERYLFKPSRIELNWLVAKLRFIVADQELAEEIKKQDEEAWHNWIYNK